MVEGVLWYERWYRRIRRWRETKTIVFLLSISRCWTKIVRIVFTSETTCVILPGLSDIFAYFKSAFEASLLKSILFRDQPSNATLVQLFPLLPSLSSFRSFLHPLLLVIIEISYFLSSISNLFFISFTDSWTVWKYPDNVVVFIFVIFWI